MASRKNEIKKDIWKILRDVYRIGQQVEITDRQNEFLDKVVEYLDENISLRRKTERSRPEPEDNEPLERPTSTPLPPYSFSNYKRLKRGETPDDDEPSAKKAPTVATTVAKPKVSINIDALPPHLRKYVKL